MPPVDALLTFFIASVLLALAPGPDNLFVLAQSALYGRNAGLCITLGLCTGLLVHTAAVAFGIAALVLASTTAFNILKILGALYLLYLAWRAFRADTQGDGARPAARLTAAGYYRCGIIMNVSNPKVAVFFLAFLPQFASPAHGPVAGQIVLLGALFMLATLLVFGVIALLAGRLGVWLGRTPAAQLLMQRVAGVVLGGLAVKLLLTTH
ncbi:MAG: LysE family translocator [Gammaproteobacteria bacterium]